MIKQPTEMTFNDKKFSMIIYGSPGLGKTTLAYHPFTGICGISLSLSFCDIASNIFALLKFTAIVW